MMIDIAGSAPRPSPRERGWEASGTGRRRIHRHQAGLTLIELLLALTLGVILVAALGFTFSAAANLQKAHAARIATQDQTARVENEITSIIQGAKLTTTATDTTSFFQGVNSGAQTDLGCDRLTLTTTAPGVPMASQQDATNDFETQQTMRGPVGGVAEVSLSTTPVGDAGGRTGLFERTQRPSDGDPTQGGIEAVFDADISDIGFQFWNGQQWITTWDTTLGDRRLPEAVQVSYILTADPQRQTHVFVVTVPESDVTQNNPDSAQGAQ